MNIYVFIHFNLIGSVRAIQQAVDNIIVMKISFTILILQYNFQTHEIFTHIIIDIWWGKKNRKWLVYIPHEKY